MHMLERVGERTEPCGTPACITLGVDISPSTETLNFLCDRKELISIIKLIENSNLDSLYSKPVCHVVSKAFSMSKNTAAVLFYKSLTRATQKTASVVKKTCLIIRCLAMDFIVARVGSRGNVYRIVA
jgi:hypothetical protein